MGAWMASELQFSLMALAVLFVLAVWIYNRWQESRQRRAARQIFAGESNRRGDPLAGEIAARDAQEQGDRERIEPVIGVEEEAASAAHEAPPLALADPAIDCLISLRPRDELAAPVFWQAQRQYLDAFADALRWLAWQQGQWRQLSAHDAGRCSSFLGALQLADRSGPLGEVALSKLLAGAGRLAEAIGAELDSPPAAALLAQAHELDQFCASVDWRIALNLVGRSGGTALDGDALRAVLRAGQFREDEDGEMRALDAAGQTQFVVCGLGGVSLTAVEGLPGLSLSIDVPLVSDGVAAFDRLLEFARTLMTAQDVELVDEQRQPLGDAALAAIRAKIAEFQEKMRAAEVPAGGRRALRLYA